MSFAKLDRDRILGEALTLMQEEGLPQVSLRKLSVRLGVSVSSLYWHVEDKDALFALMSHFIYRSCVEAVPETGTWQDWLRGFARALWQAQSRMPDTRQLIAMTGRSGHMRRERSETRLRILTLLEGKGLPPEMAAMAYKSTHALVTGWTLLASSTSAYEPADQADFEKAFDLLIEGIAAQVTKRESVRAG
jgi:TetR/AcrR family tetracycline transcriptional repressor